MFSRRGPSGFITGPSLDLLQMLLQSLKDEGWDLDGENLEQSGWGLGVFKLRGTGVTSLQNPSIEALQSPVNTLSPQTNRAL